MKSFLQRVFIDNWPRKILSLILAIIVWLVVSHSLTMTKTVSSVGVRIIHLPPGMTIEGMQTGGLMNRRVTLILSGKKSTLEDLTSSDIEVLIDASGHEKEWVETITKKNLVSLNPDINTSGIRKVSTRGYILKPTKLVKEKIPIVITPPIGEPPKGYQFLDIWPYQLYLTVSGPQDVVKKLKSRGVKLTFNLGDIPKNQLDDLKSSADAHRDVVSYYVPSHWKHIYIPSISEMPIEIDDPDAKYLRIDFVRSQLIPLKSPVQVDLFYPLQTSATFNPQKIQVGTSPLLSSKYGLRSLKQPLYAKGVSELFVEVVRSRLQIQVAVGHQKDDGGLKWSVSFVNPTTLEDRYVTMLVSDTTDKELSALSPGAREDYLRNRFRNYMNRFRLYTEDNKKLRLTFKLDGNTITVKDE